MYANGKLEAQKEKRMKGDGGGGEEEREVGKSLTPLPILLLAPTYPIVATFGVLLFGLCASMGTSD